MQSTRNHPDQDEPQSNGRAEVAVKVVKNMVRKALHHGGEDSKWWPGQSGTEVLQMKRVREKPSFPPFMEGVPVRKRRWKKGEMEPTMKTVRYLGPSPENHGHCVVKKGESPRLTRCILTKASNPPTEGE